MNRGVEFQWLILALAAALAGAEPIARAMPQSPEAEALYLLKVLKPVPDEQWKAIAGPKVAEKYEIVKGDTLYDISKRLFGDAKYWPKIWALNNDTITNPHLILPKNMINFMPGSGMTLPGVTIGGVANGSDGVKLADAGNSPASDAEGLSSSGRSLEWKRLGRQTWEFAPAPPSAEVDAHGFDRRSKVTFRKNTGFDLGLIVATDKIDPLGKITGARNPGRYYSMGDAVFISADEELQVGETYSVVGEPSKLTAPNSSRKGYAYEIQGSVKVIGVKDGVFVGLINGGHSLMSRGSYITKAPERIKDFPIIPGPTPIEGILIIDRDLPVSTTTTAQHKEVFIDRGTDDGVRPGMIFRAYEHRDPFNDKKITNSDFIVDADIMVVQVSEKFSIGLVLRSLLPIKDNATVVLLTDVTELLKSKGVLEKSLESGVNPEKDLDNLEDIDVSGGLGKKEADELRQLEKWKDNPKEGEEASGAKPADEAKGGDASKPATEADKTQGIEPAPNSQDKLEGSPPTAPENLPPPPGGDLPSDAPISEMPSESPPPGNVPPQFPAASDAPMEAPPPAPSAEEGTSKDSAQDAKDLDKLLNQ